MVKDFGYDVGGVNELLDKAVVDNAIKMVSFNGKMSYRIVSEEMQDGITSWARYPVRHRRKEHINWKRQGLNYNKWGHCWEIGWKW